MTLNVEWRSGDGADAIVVVDTSANTALEASSPDDAGLKDYLAVTGDLERWRSSMTWRPVDGDGRDPGTWGALVLSRTDGGEVLYVDPELFWDGVYRRFRSRGVDYNT